MTALVGVSALSALPALPTIPTTGCPPAAAALGSAGLGTVCQAASGVSGLAGSAASQLAGAGVNGVLDGLGSWVTSGATWLLDQIGAVVGSSTTVDLGATWFTAHYQTMAALTGVVIVPLLLLGIMQAIVRQSASMLLRSMLVHVPLALLLTAVAVKLVQLGLALTDALSSAVAQGSGLDAGHFMGSVTDALSGASAAGSPGAPAFVVFLGALAVVMGAVMVWIELLLRAAAVYVAVLFLPLGLASLAWPAIAHWCRRLVDTLVALILGKFVIVAVLSLAAGALAGGTGSVPIGSDGAAGSGTGGGSSGGFGAVLGGAALLLLAAAAPWALFRLLPFVEAGAVGHLEGVGRRARQGAAIPTRGLAQVAMRAAGAGGGPAGMAAVGMGAAAAGGVAGGAGTMTGRVARSGPDVATGRGTGARSDSPEAPDPGPSSAESTGVGTTEAPGHSIPYWEPDERATALARHYLEGGPAPEGWVEPATWNRLPGASSPSPVAVTPPRPAAGSEEVLARLPLATGARTPAWLGRDALGPKLIANRPPPDEPMRPGGGPAGPDAEV